MSPRDTELAAFSAVTRGLQGARPGQSRVIALGNNHQLWSVLVKDIALDANDLPESLKTQLIALATWSMRYSTLAILHDLPLAPLIAVNLNIADGLAAQCAPLLPTMPDSRITASIA